jgi:putative transposase
MIGHRHTIRIPKHDYSSPQIYSIVIGSFKHGQYFGSIKNKIFTPSEIGQIIKQNIDLLPAVFPVKIIFYQIMPNHIHLIIKLLPHFDKSITLGKIIRHFKAKTTYSVRLKKIFLGNFFQRNYFERIIRSDTELQKQIHYISQNPQNWFYDSERTIKSKN